MHYQARDFPEPLRARFTRLMDARVKGARHYGSVAVFDFGRNRHEHEAMRQAVLDLYKACALDYGPPKMANFPSWRTPKPKTARAA